MNLEIQTSTPHQTEHAPVAQYEAPRIESVVTEAELEREVAYAGIMSISNVLAA